MSSALEVAEMLARERTSTEKALAEHCPIPVFTCDASGRWLSCNSPLLKLLGTDERTVRNDGWLGFIHPEHVREVMAQWQELAQKKDKIKLRIIFQTADNRVLTTYTDLIRLTNGTYLGFMIPACGNLTAECPVHGFLLGHI
jgi:PAS domain S-box-containing protein